MANDLQWSSAGDPGRRLGAMVEFHPTIGSTNDRAWQLLRHGEEGTAVVADLQTAGRGRRGRIWTSPPGVNLMVSLGFRPRVSAADAWLLGAATGLAVLEACAAVVGSGRDLALKWPNDVVDSQGRKVAGLLLETAISGDRVSDAVVGAGINVNWPRAEMPAELTDRATSLLDLGGAVIDRVALLRRYLAGLADGVVRLEAGQSPLQRYRAASWLTGRNASVSAGERVISGRIRGIGDDGSLEMETSGGTVGVAYGEVVHVDVDNVPALIA
jgi:BirA family transcriptional regulator, biotin operon repressor / biotin---[acetyl-CoA-carboxylase] ligase